jgi:hypothetical protein
MRAAIFARGWGAAVARVATIFGSQSVVTAGALWMEDLMPTFAPLHPYMLLLMFPLVAAGFAPYLNP